MERLRLQVRLPWLHTDWCLHHISSGENPQRACSSRLTRIVKKRSIHTYKKEWNDLACLWTVKVGLHYWVVRFNMQNALKAKGKTNEQVKDWMQIDSTDRRARKPFQKYGAHLILRCVEYAICFHYHRFLIMLITTNRQSNRQSSNKQVLRAENEHNKRWVAQLAQSARRRRPTVCAKCEFLSHREFHTPIPRCYFVPNRGPNTAFFDQTVFSHPSTASFL